MNTQTISLDIDKRHAVREPITIAQGDRNGTTIAATIYDGGTLVTTSGLSARFRMRLPDGRHFYEKTATWNAVSGTATVIIDETQAASAPGTTSEAYFELLSGTTVIHSTSRFSVRVLRSATEGFDPATSYSDRIEELLDGLDELPLPANVTPVMDGTASVGTSGRYARQDHRHPTDTSRASTDVATTSANGLMSATDKSKLDGIAANANAYELPPATASALGGVKPDGTTITVDSDGTIHGASTYELPTMSASTKGGAKLGDGLALTDGALGIDPEPQESTGAVRGAIASLTAKGWATQTQTTGKNLYSQDTETVHEHNDTWSSAGISYVKDTHGIIHATGTATANSWAYGGSSATNTALFKTLPAGDYVASTSAYRIAGRKLSDGVSEALFTTGVGPIAFTLTEPTSVCVIPVIPTGTTVNDLEIWLQVESGSTATDYEPYSGCAPSPSPDYAQEIQVARGRNLISRTLSNLKSLNTSGTWNGNVYSYGGVTYTVNDDGSITLSGARTSGQTSNFRLAHTNNTLVLDAGTYTLSGCPVGGSDSTYRLDMYSDGNIMANDHGGGASFTISETKEFERVLILPYAGVNVTGLTFYPQLELGSVPTPYVPYGHVGVEVQGRNLIDVAHALVGKGRNISTGVIENAPTITWGDQLIPVTAGESLTKQGFTGSMRLFFFGADGSFLSTSLYNTSTNTITVPSGAAYFDWQSTTTYITDTAQLERGSTAHTHQPYFNETIHVPLPAKGYAASLPDGTADVLTVDGAGKVEWASAVDEVVIDGTESWSASKVTTNCCYITITRTDTGRSSDFISAISTHYAYTQNAASLMPDKSFKIGAASGGVNELLYIRDSVNAVSTSALTAWFAQNPVTILYSLATPVTEQVGYIDWPSIPDGAIITCPELDALGVRYLIGNSVATMARQWYERAKSEYESRLLALEQAVAELATA